MGRLSSLVCDLFHDVARLVTILRRRRSRVPDQYRLFLRSAHVLFGSCSAGDFRGYLYGHFPAYTDIWARLRRSGHSRP